MGIFSWFSSRWREDRSAGGWHEDRSGDGPTLVVGNLDDDSDIDEIRRDAAADVAAVEQDDKYFGPHSPANRSTDL
jgi:hypothetical protein